jgi:hypothetical protein
MECQLDAGVVFVSFVRFGAAEGAPNRMVALRSRNSRISAYGCLEFGVVMRCRGTNVRLALRQSRLVSESIDVVSSRATHRREAEGI